MRYYSNQMEGSRMGHRGCIGLNYYFATNHPALIPFQMLWMRILALCSG